MCNHIQTGSWGRWDELTRSGRQKWGPADGSTAGLMAGRLTERMSTDA